MRIVAVLVLLTVVGCSSSTAPPISLSGTWAYKVSNLTGGGWTCEEAVATMMVTQTGSILTGSVGDNLVCTIGAQSAFFGPYSGTITGGTISGDQVSFDFQTLEAWTSTGTISGRTMSGNATVTLHDPYGAPPTVVMSGQWSATKQYP